MVEVFVWATGRGDEIMYRHPRDTLNWGDQVNVMPNQVAVFIKDSVAYDVLKSVNICLKRFFYCTIASM